MPAEIESQYLDSMVTTTTCDETDGLSLIRKRDTSNWKKVEKEKWRLYFDKAKENDEMEVEEKTIKKSRKGKGKKKGKEETVNEVELLKDDFEVNMMLIQAIIKVCGHLRRHLHYNYP